MSHRRPPRLPSFDYLGKYHYFLTCCVLDRQKLFSSAERVDAARSQILRTFDERGFAEIASTFMPDHVHIAMEGLTDNCDFKHCMMVARQRSTREFRKQFKQLLWQDGYFDRVLRNVDEIQSVVNYLANNPVRAGLCARAEDYPYTWIRAPHRRT